MCGERYPEDEEYQVAYLEGHHAMQCHKKKQSCATSVARNVTNHMLVSSGRYFATTIKKKKRSID